MRASAGRRRRARRYRRAQPGVRRDAGPPRQRDRHRGRHRAPAVRPLAAEPRPAGGGTPVSRALDVAVAGRRSVPGCGRRPVHRRHAGRGVPRRRARAARAASRAARAAAPRCRRRRTRRHRPASTGGSRRSRTRGRARARRAREVPQRARRRSRGWARRSRRTCRARSRVDVVTWAPASARVGAAGVDHGELARACGRARDLRPAGTVAARTATPGPPQTGAPRAERRRGPGSARLSVRSADCMSSSSTTSRPRAPRSRPPLAALRAAGAQASVAAADGRRGHRCSRTRAEPTRAYTPRPHGRRRVR